MQIITLQQQKNKAKNRIRGEKLHKHLDNLISALLIVILSLSDDVKEPLAFGRNALKSANNSPRLPRVMNTEYVIQEVEMRLKLVRVVIGAHPEQLVEQLERERHVLVAEELNEFNGLVGVCRLFEKLLDVVRAFVQHFDDFYW
jgi:hypothetical protein